MNTFIDHIISKTDATAAGPDTLYLFPNRRAGVHFKQALAKQLAQPIWAPTVMSGADFIKQQYKPHTILDQLTLLFELYSVYRERTPGTPQPFEQFYPWGQMMLRDFDEVDRYLVDGQRLFYNVRDLRELEQRFGPDLADYEAYRAFWETFSSTELGGAQETFVRIWQQLSHLYQAFRAHLTEKQMGYEGMAYRALAEELSWIEQLPYKKVYVCGFNALSASEKRIFSALIEQKNAQLFWDVDRWYLDNPKHEAGYFLRENFKDGLPQPDSIPSSFTEQPKHIMAKGVPGAHGQVQVALDQLDEWINEPDFVAEETAIVLGDESLLFPLLYALPTSLPSFNITMGYSLQHAFTYAFVDLLLQLHTHPRGSRSNPAFSHRHVSALLQHPFVTTIIGEPAQSMQAALIHQRLLFPSVQWLTHDRHPLLQHLFTPLAHKEDLLPYLRQTLLKISDGLANTAPDQLAYEPAFLLRFYKILQRLEDLTVKYSGVIEQDMLQRILRQLSASESLSFSGEPVEGLQIMGLLETRVLDFKRVIVLSVNEGQLPSTQRHHSYVPFHIRKAFGLPTFEQQDGLTAYHFFRLLQRVEAATLVYNTVPGRMSEGEPSRFLKQLAYEWAPLHPDKLQFEDQVVQIAPAFHQPAEITIEKDANVLAQLDSFLKSGGRKWSATALNTYIQCPLQFYLSYIAGLAEPDRLEEDMDAATLGDIFHNAMEELFKPYKGKALEQETLGTFAQTLPQALLAQYRALYQRNMDKPEGRNVLNYAFLQQSGSKILAIDNSKAPFEVVDVEGKYHGDLTFTANGKTHTVTFTGLFDRLDKKEDVYQVLDYKTGASVEVHKKALEAPEKYLNNPKKKAALQGLLYAWLLLQKEPDARVEVGFYHLRDLRKGIKWLTDHPLRQADLEPFTQFLQQKLAEIFDPTIPFDQTDDVKRCEYCAFRQMCQR